MSGLTRTGAFENFTCVGTGGAIEDRGVEGHANHGVRRGTGCRRAWGPGGHRGTGWWSKTLEKVPGAVCGWRQGVCPGTGLLCCTGVIFVRDQTGKPGKPVPALNSCSGIIPKYLQFVQISIAVLICP